MMLNTQNGQTKSWQDKAIMTKRKKNLSVFLTDEKIRNLKYVKQEDLIEEESLLV